MVCGLYATDHPCCCSRHSAQMRDFLGGTRRVAFGLNGITVFLASDEIRKLFHDLYE